MSETQLDVPRILLGEACEATLKLEAVLRELPPGTFVTYLELERVSKVDMDDRGKACMRSALRRLQREYLCSPNSGIELVAAGTAMTAVTTKLERISGAVKRGARTVGIVEAQFLPEMSPEAARDLRFVASVFSAIEVAAEHGRQLYAKQHRELPPPILTISVPEC